jgi:hypothetical protein
MENLQKYETCRLSAKLDLLSKFGSLTLHFNLNIELI